MYLVTTEVGHSTLDAWKYPLPGDESIFMIERVVIHVNEEPRRVTLNMPPDPHRSSTADHVAGRGVSFLTWNGALTATCWRLFLLPGITSLPP